MKTVNVEFGSHVKLPPIEKPANSESTPMNLLLSQFYDGGQLFKWRICNDLIGDKILNQQADI